MYLACSHLPFAFMLLNMLVVFQPDTPLHVCAIRSKRHRCFNSTHPNHSFAALIISLIPVSLVALRQTRTDTMFNTSSDVGTVSMICAECIFMVRAYAVWDRGRWFAAVEIFAVFAYVAPITVSLQQFNSRVSEPCWIPGVSGYLDTETSIRIFVAFGLLAIAELQTLLLLLYRVSKGRGGWGIDNRLMRGLMKDNLLYCGSGFAFSVSVILTANFCPFPIGHMLAECQVVIQALLVTRMHRGFWRSDRAFCGIATDVSLSTWMTEALDFT
ncbi:hypothetical protein BDR03DRAFT_1091724 [Suillus americanus]|nr:hypothetical protein BDR03DRAFT_1091724 [Suillus americanus]